MASRKYMDDEKAGMHGSLRSTGVAAQQTKRPNATRRPESKPEDRSDGTRTIAQGELISRSDPRRAALRGPKLINPSTGGASPGQIADLRAGRMLRPNRPVNTNNSRPINTRLASGTGAAGEPVFDNASIQRGIEQEIIADPKAEQARIENNQQLDRAQTLRTLPQNIASGRVTTEAGEVINTTADNENRATVDAFNAATSRQEAITRARIEEAESNLRGSGGRGSGGRGGRGDAPAVTIDTLNAARNAYVDEDGNPVPIDPATRANTDRALQNGDIPMGEPESSIVVAEQIAQKLHSADTLKQRSPARGLGAGSTYAIIREMAMNPDQDVFDVGGGSIQLKDMFGGLLQNERTFLEESAAAMRAGILQSAVDKVDRGDPLEPEELQLYREWRESSDTPPPDPETEPPLQPRASSLLETMQYFEGS